MAMDYGMHDDSILVGLVRPPGLLIDWDLIRVLRGPSGQAAQSGLLFQPIGDALAHLRAAKRQTGLRNRSAGLQAALVLLGGRHWTEFDTQNAQPMPAAKFILPV
jgi:hypothetical protein